MRIGIDATCWWNNRGFGRFTRELIKAMIDSPKDHEFVLFVDQAPAVEMQHDHVTIIQVEQSLPVTQAASASSSRTIKDLLLFRQAVKRQSLDLFFFPAVYSWYPTPFGLPVVLTLHDAIAEHFPELIFPHWQGKMMWSLKMKLARWQANRIMTVSHAAKKEIIDYLGIKANKIDVVPEAADRIFQPVDCTDKKRAVRKKYNIPQDTKLILYVGGLAPHKNIKGFLKALHRVNQGSEACKLHIALIGDPGGDGFHSDYGSLVTFIENQAPLSNYVHFTGYIPDEDLVTLYSDARALALPSFSEGFGLPAIEAMACKVPVLASAKGSLPEVVGDAGIYFDPYDVEQMANAIEQIVADELAYINLKDKAFKRSSQFSWSKAAKKTFCCLESTYRQGR